MMHLRLTGCLLAIGVLLPGLACADLYRYVDDRGVTVLTRQGVPPEFVGKGFEVINEQGRVLRVVPPAPTAEERKQREARALQTQADRQLMRLYANVKDVDRARDRKLAELDSLIGVANSNLQSIRIQQGNVLSQAAELERSGQVVPDQILAQISDLKDEQARLGKDIDRYQKAREQAQRSFAADRVRVQTLVGGDDKP
ncbi:DUF4124 domain-containing protein [Pseudomonas matsuisoli]|uniref:DUF4124 domain-containing protein n=1 Tax=Pseudomonas matsuisoli TaxID=1515666 RepID=A0A917V0U9_9PSED|nr:DUF4124 domain-containing protein [Pseudomonas matsuisoli]GGK05277.1 hypothetical protein GCM10009304_34250 [Pseudomonas matsuisoli]